MYMRFNILIRFDSYLVSNRYCLGVQYNNCMTFYCLLGGHDLRGLRCCIVNESIRTKMINIYLIF